MNGIKHILEYKGFIGSIEADADENILYGFVQNIPNGKTDSISYEGETIKELRKDFEEAIDFYLEESQWYQSL
ncbi:hypothetical protein [Butyrivibrio sp. YAB3001]|uniref:hypothetical protein n=1 Tax=Butyrivibrio sp. YAB3001 TaxID=1520812 RepID=UPI0008F62ADA|nr:hypothetical protein [Butyrivibrio sp. YAB3001]SFD11950.1 hypothetical protein SAMN02910398_04114 [Butyrivibrio sp. YAB3001]